MPRGRVYQIRGATTKAKLKKQKGSSAPGGGSGKHWFERLHCRSPRPENPLCSAQHTQPKCEGEY